MGIFKTLKIETREKRNNFLKSEKKNNYGEREHKKLVKMVEAAEELKKKDGQDSVMVEDKINIETTDKIGDTEVMDTSAKMKTFSKKSLKDEDGNYPKWMSMRKIQSQKKKNKAAAKKRGKVSKKK